MSDIKKGRKKWQELENERFLKEKKKETRYFFLH
jgi:hypothetical protein